MVRSVPTPKIGNIIRPPQAQVSQSTLTGSVEAIAGGNTQVLSFLAISPTVFTEAGVKIEAEANAVIGFELSIKSEDGGEMNVKENVTVTEKVINFSHLPISLRRGDLLRVIAYSPTFAKIWYTVKYKVS
jgi:hypothetical protein